MKGRTVIFLFFNGIASVFQLPLLQEGLSEGVNVEHEALHHLGITDDYIGAVDWRSAFGRLAERYKIVNDQMIKAKEDFRKESLMVSILSKIKFWEDKLAPKFVGKQNDNTAYVNFQKERWAWIIKNSSDPVVIKMNEFIRYNLNNDTDLFCTRIADLFTFSISRSEHIPPFLHEYNVEEVDKIMRSKFNINDDTTLELVHFFMKT